MNPIENEAVVASVLNEFGPQLVLEDVGDQLPGLDRRPGLTQWAVCQKDKMCSTASQLNASVWKRV